VYSFLTCNILDNVETSAFDVFKSKPSFVIVTCGTCPMIAAYSSDPNADQSISASQIASKYATKVSTAVFSFTKSFIWGSRDKNNDEDEDVSQNKVNGLQPLLKSSKAQDMDDHRR
jgi:hypothetical protein